MDHIKKHAKLLVSLMLGGFFFLSLSLAWQETTTFDEKAHIPAAYSYVRYGDMNLNPEHPPLLKDLVGIPLLFMNLSFPTDSPLWQDGVNEQWAIGDLFIHGNNAEQVTFWARVPVILVAVLLGLVIYLFTKRFVGTVAGLFALLLYVSDPNIIAHGHYVTTDLAIAAVIFFAIISLIPFLRKPDAKNTVILGLVLGVAQLTKFSAVLLFPYFAAVILLYALTKSKPDTERESRFRFAAKRILDYGLRYTGAVLVCFALVWVVYSANIVNEPGTKMVETAKAFFPQDNDPARFAIGTVSALSDSALTRPFAQYLLGFFKVFSRVAGGNTHYFLGTVSTDADPWYFPVVFALKETLPFLFLLLFGGTVSLFRIAKTIHGKPVRSWHSLFAHSFQGHVTQYVMFGFVAFYAYISITGNLNIGFRHLFPVLPLLYVLVTKAVFDFIRHRGFRGEHASRAALAALSFFLFSVPVLSYPSYLSYFNEAAGGPKNGYRIATDSNYDWGQDLKRLRDFVDEFDDCKAGTADFGVCDKYADIIDYPKIDTIRTAYFGGANPEYYLGDTYVEWYADWGRRSGWHAISINWWQESLYQDNPQEKLTYQWIIDGGYPLAWRAGDSILVYYVPPSPGLE